MKSVARYKFHEFFYILQMFFGASQAFIKSSIIISTPWSNHRESCITTGKYISPITRATNKISSDAFLNSLEEMDGKDPSNESLAALRESATSSVATFLSTFESEEKHIEENPEATLKEETNSNIPEVEWDVYVCQSKQSKERGASATLDTFQSLSPPNILLHPGILSKSKAKGPNIRCVQKKHPYKAFEVNNVNDIDKVYRILTKHMGIENVSIQARDCLKYTYQGNLHLEKDELGEAIASYNSALATKYEPQEGILLLLRATAYLKRAFQHQAELRKTVSDLSETVPEDPAQLGRLYQLASQYPALSKPLFNKVLSDTKLQDKKFRQTKYRHGLYEYALLHAAQDSLRSTQLLPHHSKTYLRAGDALAELRKLKESALYYQKAIELDPALKGRLEPVIKRLERSQQFLEKAKGWYSSDTLRLALDVAG
jgi:hypothetical protein